MTKTLLAMIIGLVVPRYVDHFVFPEICFVEEFKKGIAAAIVAGMALLFMALVLSSAVR